MKLDIDRTKEFLLKRFKGDIGGFSGTPLLPPTLEDTYFGVRTLFKIDKSLVLQYKHNIVEFLRSFIKQNSLLIENLYKISDIYILLNEDFQKTNERIFRSFLSYTKKIAISKLSIYRLYCVWKLSEKFNIINVLLLIKKFLKNIKPNNVEDIYYLGLIDENIWYQYIEFIVESQNGDGGFGFYPGTTSYLENTYFALQIIGNFYPEGAEAISKGKEFALACYNWDGGFARKPGGISYLATTYYGVDLIIR